MSKTAYIGIDPGMSQQKPGAAALIADNERIEFHDWSSEKAAAGALRTWSNRYKILGISIEQVFVRKGEGHSSKLLENMGFWKGLSYMICQPVMYLPQQWQMIYYGMPFPVCIRNEPKQRSIHYARVIFPQVKEQLYLKKHSGRSDALLIAEYGKRLDMKRRKQIDKKR